MPRRGTRRVVLHRRYSRRAPFRAEPVVELPEAPSRIPRDRSNQGRDHGGLPSTRRCRRLVVPRPRAPHHATGALHRQLMVGDEQGGHRSLRGRPDSFRCRTSLIAAFSRARSAYIRYQLGVLRLKFPQPLHVRHRCAPVLAPPLVALLTPCCRSRSATGTPFSASLRIPAI